MILFWNGIAVFAAFWLIYPFVGVNEDFKDLSLAVGGGWIAYWLYAFKFMIQAADENLDCGSERRQKIVALLIIGGLIPIVTLMESWRGLSSNPNVFAFANVVVPVISFSFLLTAIVLIVRTPPKSTEIAPSSPGDAGG